MTTLRYLIPLLFLFSCAPPQSPLTTILKNNSETLGSVVENAAAYELQIRYTQINRDSANFPSFTSYNFRVADNEYFYPASTVKMPVAFLALERINQLRQDTAYQNLDKHTPLRIEASRPAQTSVQTDSSAQNGIPSIAHYIKKIFVVSDNDAYNRLFEFLGRQNINHNLQNKGFHNTHILHRLGVNGYDNRYTNPFTFYEGENVIYQQDEQFDTNNYPSSPILKGIAYVNAEGKKIVAPFDFGVKNKYSIVDMEATLKAVIFPETIPEAKRFQLTKEDYTYLYHVMAALPRTSQHPTYDTTTYYDSYGKFFLFGDRKNPIPKHIRIFNKVGYAYGYLTDCAYIIDLKNKVEFILTASIYVNKNQTFNDDTYEYEEIGIPFLANLGRAIYQYELNRKYTCIPNLDKFSTK